MSTNIGAEVVCGHEKKVKWAGITLEGDIGHIQVTYCPKCKIVHDVLADMGGNWRFKDGC